MAAFTGSFRANESTIPPLGLVPTPEPEPEPAPEPEVNEIVSDSSEGEPIELVAEPLTPEQEAEVEASGEEIPVITSEEPEPEPEAAADPLPNGDWTVAELDAWAAEHPDIATDYLVSTNKPWKVEYLLAVTGQTPEV